MVRRGHRFLASRSFLYLDTIFVLILRNILILAASALRRRCTSEPIVAKRHGSFRWKCEQSGITSIFDTTGCALCICMCHRMSVVNNNMSEIQSIKRVWRLHELIHWTTLITRLCPSFSRGRAKWLPLRFLLSVNGQNASIVRFPKSFISMICLWKSMDSRKQIISKHLTCSENRSDMILTYWYCWRAHYSLFKLISKFNNNANRWPTACSSLSLQWAERFGYKIRWLFYISFYCIPYDSVLRIFHFIFIYFWAWNSIH